MVQAREFFLPLAGVVLACFPLMGCLSGNSYPDSYARAFCGSLFGCYEADSVEDVTGWDDADECREDRAAALREGAGYDSWEEGDASFDSDAAEACQGEAQEFRNDSDCAGEALNFFSYAAFLLDVSDEACASVYDED